MSEPAEVPKCKTCGCPVHLDFYAAYAAAKGRGIECLSCCCRDATEWNQDIHDEWWKTEGAKLTDGITPKS